MHLQTGYIIRLCFGITIHDLVPLEEACYLCPYHSAVYLFEQLSCKDGTVGSLEQIERASACFACWHIHRHRRKPPRISCCCCLVDDEPALTVSSDVLTHLSCIRTACKQVHLSCMYKGRLCMQQQDKTYIRGYVRMVTQLSTIMECYDLHCT
jgi:hypothetical protein